MPDRASIAFCGSDGRPIENGSVEIWAVHEDDEAIRISEVVESGEPVLQLREDTQYDYFLESDVYHLRGRTIVVPSRKKDGVERGRINTGSYVGLLTLELLDRESSNPLAEEVVEIRSRKMSYEKDYRYMLEDIAERCSELLMELRSPVSQHFEPAETDDAQTLVQRLSFLKSLLGAEDFQNALHRIITMPNTLWKEEIRNVPVGQSRRIGRREIRQLAKGARRVDLPESHPLWQQNILQSLPERMDVRDKRDTVDTPENRFVKHALETFQKTLEEMQEKLQQIGRKSDGWIVSEIQGLIDGLDETLSRGFFREILRPEFLPLGSPVLQRKEGYREVLRAWLQFDLSARLCWKGGEDVYSAGKRDVATLYEYWVFFRLLDVVSEVFELDAPKSERLIVKTADGFGLKLRAGRHTPLRGSCKAGGRKLKLKLSYNRTFARHGKDPEVNYPAKGSWTERMRPDYTLTLWPAVFSEQEAEEQELISHVHFDAKYRIDRIQEMFGSEDKDLKGRQLYEDLDQEARQEIGGTYKRADLLKMHAYRDAIRRTAGAYVLYPGSEAKEWRGFHEIIPGLGAFPLRPMEKGDGTDELKAFLLEVAVHVSNRATQREQHTYHTYRIHKDNPPQGGAVHEVLSEAEDQCRTKPPGEVFVLPGWHNGSAHLDWIASRGLYNFRTERHRGSLRLHHSVAGASYLLLHGDGEYQCGGRMFRIVSDGPRVFSKEKLLELGYPGGASQPYYLVYDVEPLDGDDPLSAYDWDLQPIDGIDDGRGSPVPKKGVPLSEFMKGAMPKS
jgi:predicted component of viral defense system (DUF524 family)